MMGLPGTKRDLAIIIARGPSLPDNSKSSGYRKKPSEAEGPDEYSEVKNEGMLMACDKIISAVKQGDSELLSKSLEQWCNLSKMGSAENYDSNDLEI